MVALPEGSTPADEDAAYRLQFALHAWFEAEGWGARVGWKVGATTNVMQELLGIDHPCAGGVMQRRRHQGAASFEIAEFCRVGIESEIAVRLATDLGPDGAPYATESVAGHVAAVMAAMEIVDDRYGDFRAAPLPLLIADDFFQSACVLGPEITDWQGRDLAACQGRTLLDGKEAGSGAGAEVMGHPLAALAWLANRLAPLGLGLKAGEVVLLGSLVAVQWLEGPVEAASEIDGLGRVTATFA